MWNGAIDFIDYTPSGQRLWQMQLSVQIFQGILGEKYRSSLRWLLGVLSLTYVLLYLSHCMYYCVVSQIQIIIAECLFPHTVWSMYGMEQLPLLITPPPANGSDRCSSLSNSARQHYIAGWHWNVNVIILMKLSFMAALKVVKMTTFSAASKIISNKPALLQVMAWHQVGDEANTWANGDPVQWHIHVALGGDELNS